MNQISIHEWRRLKRLAHRRPSNEIRRGVRVKLPCELCGEIEVDAHHDDYLRPSDIRWLCKKHHREYHLINGYQTPPPIQT